MATNKYINTSDVMELTGRTPDEIRGLAQTGELPAHKTRRGHWRFNMEVIEKYFGIQINKPKEEIKPKEEVQKTYSTRVITGDYYQEVIKRICEAKSSIRIMTGDFRRLNLKPTASQGNKYKSGTLFIDFLVEKANKGVSVQIISSEDSDYFQEDVEKADREVKNNLFSVWFCARNHAKVVIIDDKIAYIGSANMTKAGLWQPYVSPGNFEIGILTEDPEVITSLNVMFSRITKCEFCEDCHRKKDCIEYN